MRFKFKKLRIIIFLSFVSFQLSAQKKVIIFNENDSNFSYKVKLGHEVVSCFGEIKKGNSQKIITLFLENIDNKFDSAAGIDLYLVNRNNPDSVEFLTSITVPNEDASQGGYKSKATYRIELNSYLNDKQYSAFFYSSCFILKMRVVNFSNTPMAGNLIIDNIKVTCTSQK
jgi:hypothetical protein